MIFLPFPSKNCDEYVSSWRVYTLEPNACIWSNTEASDDLHRLEVRNQQPLRQGSQWVCSGPTPSRWPWYLCCRPHLERYPCFHSGGPHRPGDDDDLPYHEKATFPLKATSKATLFGNFLKLLVCFILSYKKQEKKTNLQHSTNMISIWSTPHAVTVTNEGLEGFPTRNGIISW